MEVDSHIGAAMSGLIADARTLVDHARVEAQNHRFTYDEPMRVEALTQAVCDLALSFGEVRRNPCCLEAVSAGHQKPCLLSHDVTYAFVLVCSTKAALAHVLELLCSVVLGFFCPWVILMFALARRGRLGRHERSCGLWVLSRWPS